jgi:WD40 repeat protein
MLLPGVKEQEVFVDHCWLAAGRMLVVTEQGSVLVFDTHDQNVELKSTITVPLPYHGIKVETIAARTNPSGFLVSGSMGFFGVYEKTEHDQKEPFLLLHTFSAGEDAVSSIAVSPSDETVACFTAGKKLLTFPLGGCDIIAEDEDAFKDLVPKGIHTGGVVAMDTCRQKPLVFTVSSDKTCRVWHYLKWRCELVHQLTEEPTSVACHPSGFQVLIGFKERVRLYNVLLDSLRPCRDLALKQCRELRFSNGGHMFACAIGIS